MTTFGDLDGRLAQGWGGRKPNGCRVIVVLARRGGTTAAGLLTTLTVPTERLAPILVSVGETPDTCTAVQPPTLLVGHEVAASGRTAALIVGACQVGTAQGVLDSVAEGLLEPDQETMVFVSLWLDHDADDETSVRYSVREAVGDAVRDAVTGHTKEQVRGLVEDRDRLTHPYYGGD
ncbi:formaldehyde-activating enzyme [Saccharopolyspora sp. NPDC047091]|uniref:formaldehyde-activating enzyme n=1 Tax=Saccharopolyspora sp. NPDC047091 TaxID=3155924 RepID=UPI0033EDE857